MSIDPIPPNYRKLLPPEVRNWPAVGLDEAMQMVRDGTWYCGLGLDVYLPYHEIGDQHSFALASILRLQYPHEYPNHAMLWVSMVLPAEIKFLLDIESRGEKLLFFVSSQTLDAGYLSCHVYEGYDGPEFGFTAWEIRHLLPMFPNVCSLTWMEDVGWYSMKKH